MRGHAGFVHDTRGLPRFVSAWTAAGVPIRAQRKHPVVSEDGEGEFLAVGDLDPLGVERVGSAGGGSGLDILGAMDGHAELPFVVCDALELLWRDDLHGRPLVFICEDTATT